jgi:hypothetical protein
MFTIVQVATQWVPVDQNIFDLIQIILMYIMCCITKILSRWANITKEQFSRQSKYVIYKRNTI